MWRIVGSKLVPIVPVLLIVTFATMALTSLIPGSAAVSVLGTYASKSEIAAFNRRFGFNLPLFDRYWHWVVGVFHGNLGLSTQNNEPVAASIGHALPVTLEIAIGAIVLSLLIAIPLAIVSAIREGGILDRIVTGVSSMLLSAPTFVTSVVFVYIIAVRANILPPSGWVPLGDGIAANLQHAALPIFTLTAAISPVLLRVLRGDVITILREDYVLTARARGLPSWYILSRHVLRPASISLLTVSGLLFGYLFGGSVIVETFFSLPGLGQEVSLAITAKDSPMLLGIVLCVAGAYVIVNGAVDLLTAAVDPRIREASTGG
jgi:peptide/nickel transport system permease protein